MKNKKHFGQKRLIFFAEVPQMSEGELAEVKKAKGEEKEELNIGSLVDAVNGEVNKHAEQLKELPKEYNDLLHNEIKAYLERSTGRYEKDEVKGLSSKEFADYVAAMKAKVEEMMKEWAPTEDDIKAKKEAEAKGKEAKNQAEKIMSPEDRDKILNTDPSSIGNLDQLGNAFDAYDQANGQMQQDAIKVFKPVQDFQKTYGDFKKARGGLKAYKQFSAYLWPEDDSERIKIQDSLNDTKKKVSDAQKKFGEQKKKLSDYGKNLGEVSNRLKSDKISERDTHLKEIDDTSEAAKKERELRKDKYDQLEQMQLKLFGQMKKLGEYHDGLKGAQEKQQQKMLVGQEGEGKLKDFKKTTDDSLARITEALQNPNLTDDQKKKLEDTKKQLEERSQAADTGLQNMGDTLEETQRNVGQLEEGERKTANETLTVQTHLTNQVEPTLKSLNESLIALDEAKMKFATDRDEVSKYYTNSLDGLDKVDGAVDGAILKNNVANEQLEKQLNSLAQSLDKTDVSPPSGLGGAFEATVGVPFRMLGGGIGAVGGGITDVGKWFCEQGNWLSNATEGIKGKTGYWPARIGTEIVNFPIGVAGGIIEMAGGLLTLGGNLTSHPLDTVAGLGSMIGRDPGTGEWSLKTAGHTWKEMGKSIISYDDFSEGHIGLALGKIFPNVVITIETLGSAPGAKIATQAASEARVAFAAARAEGAGVMRATARASGTFITEGAVALAAEAKALPQAMKAFVVGSEGEGSLLARLSEKYEAFSKITVGEAAGAVGEGLTSIGKDIASKAETYYGGKRFESLRLRKMAGQQLGLVDELSTTTDRYQEYQNSLQKMKKQVKAENAAMAEEDIDKIARYRLSQQDRQLALDGSAHEKKLEDLTKSQKAFEDEVTKNLAEGNQEKARKFLDGRNAAEKGMIDTGKNFNEFKQLLDKGDPKAVDAARQFQEALATRDPKMIKAWKETNWNKIPKEWQGAFQNMEYRFQYASASQEVSFVQSADRLEKGIARLPDQSPEAVSKFIDDYNKKFPGAATGEPRILYKLPEGKGSVVLGPDGKVVYLEKSALDSHFYSVFSEDIPASIKAEGKTAKDVAGWIDDTGKIHYSSAYFEEKYGVKMTQKEGKNVFVIEGQEMSPMEFFRTDKGKEVLKNMKTVKDHEVTHRLLEATDKASGGAFGKKWQDMITSNPELFTAFARRGEVLNARTAQEFLCEVADGRAKLSAETLTELEGSLGESINGFSFDNVRKIDTKMLNFSSPGALGRSFEDAFTALDPHAILNNRSYQIAYDLAQSQYPEIFKAKGPELQKILESGTEIQRKALAYRNASLRKNLVAGEETRMASATEKMKSTADAYKKFAEAQPEMSEEIWRNYRAAMNGTKNDLDAVRQLYPVKPEVFDYIEASIRAEKAAGKIRLSSIREKVERDIIDKSLGLKDPKQIEAYVQELNSLIEPVAGEAGSVATLPKDKGSIFLNREGRFELRKGKGVEKASELDLVDFDDEIEAILKKQAETDKAYVVSFTDKYPLSPKLKRALDEGKITPARLREIEGATKNMPPQRAVALTDLIFDRPELGTKVMNTLKKARSGLLTEDHIDALVMGTVDGENLGLLEANIADGQLTKEYVEKIINATPETLDGGRVKYFEGDHIGQGGIARFFRVAYYEPPSNKLRFTGCKKVLDQNVGFVTLDREAVAARRVLKAKTEGMSTENIINPLYVSADSTTIFYDIAEYQEGGVTKQGDLEKISEQPNIPPEQIYQLVLDNATGLAKLHEKGYYHLDIKPGNIVKGQNGGVTIDLGSLSNESEFIDGMNNGIPTRTISINGKDYWVGKIPGGIGVTPGYYNDAIAEGIAAGSLPMWKLDAYALGTEIKEMATGKVAYQRFGAIPGSSDLGPSGVFDEFGSGVKHEFTNPAKNQEILKLAAELMDPANTTTTIASASQRLKAILAMP